MATDDWLLVEGTVTVLVPVTPFRAEVSPDGQQVRGRTEHGQLVLAAVAWLVPEDRERVEKVLEDNEG